MTRTRKVLLGSAGVVLVLVAIGGWYAATREAREPSRVAWQAHCAGCHGEALEGASAPALVDVDLRHGDSTTALMASISAGMPGVDGHAFGDQLPDKTVKALALLIGERRRHWPSTGDSHASVLPEGVVESRHHNFAVELVATLPDRPYGIAPLPDGSVLVTRKLDGLLLVAADGGEVAPVPGTPETYGAIADFGSAYLAYGTHLDVELHPEHADNGWVYLSHTDRCQLDCGSVVPQTMTRVVRGRLRNGAWVDEEEVWAVDHHWYSVAVDQVACGRLAFGGDNSLYLTVGGKARYVHLHDMHTPYGKVHRVLDDGTVPPDNPLPRATGERADTSTRHTVWSWGHRTAQGLTAHPVTGEIWQSEMGPRGGDEVNRIVRGGNFGWPLYTNGLDYSGEPVSIGVDLGLDFPFADTVAPVVDFTPAPALSGMTFASGSSFDGWGDDLLVGSLKARTLYRVRIRDGVAVEQEDLLAGIGRIRDVEVGPDGAVYLALEHGATGSLVRLVPRATH